jgi:hypothetical protein
VFRCETHFHKWGRVQGLKPNDFKMHSHFGSCTHVGVANVQSPGWKGKKNIKLGPHDTIKKVLKCRCLKCPHIVHLDLICMSYDQKKG